MAAPSFRAALYWAPALDDALTEAGNAWLGRDAEGNIACAQPAISGLAQATEAPRRYGLHATLRPPIRLATGWPEFCAAAENLARTHPSFDLPPLEVADMSGFLALRLVEPCLALHRLANACVTATDRHRLPPDADELARRQAHSLTPQQHQMLERWGYPYVMDEWRFHVTLTGRLDPSTMERLRPVAEAHFARSLQVRRRIREISIFTQAAQEPFLVAERLPLTG